MSWSGIEPRSPRPLANTLPTGPTIQPRLTNKMWHKVSFLAEFNGFEFGVFFLLYRLPSSSLSCHAASTDLPDHHSLPISIVHRSREVFQAFCIGAELLYIGSNWSSCLYSSTWRCPQSVPLMSSSLHLQQCPACLVCLTRILFVIGDSGPYW